MSTFTLPSPLPLPGFLERPLDRLASNLLQPEGRAPVDFADPPGEEGLVGPDSVSWRVFKNPISLFIGGVAAVILEFGDPGVRTGVWEHSSFRTDPVRRLQRTGLAAMLTVYGPRTKTEAMIAGVVRIHEKVAGTTPDGRLYHANDPDLLNWVQATAGYGFSEAYSRFVSPLSQAELDSYYREGIESARLYGAVGAPTSTAELRALFESKRDRLQASPLVFEFIKIMQTASAFPPALRPVQRLLVRAAVDLVPDWIRERLGLSLDYGLRPWQRSLVKSLGSISDKVVLRSSPAVQSCLRLGLPTDYLYRRHS